MSKRRNLSTKDEEWILLFLNEHKKLLGLGSYAVTVEKRILEADDAFVQVESDPLEKTMKVTTYRGFFERTTDQQRKDLLHELVHARLDIMNQIVEQHKEHIEEDCANDITSAIWKLLSDEKDEGFKKGK